jgi:tetratricopeptide (TPR) repeat protein
VAPRRRRDGTCPVRAVAALPCRWLALASLCLLASTPGWALNRGLLVKELQLPKIALNLNVTFSTDELRIPSSATPQADLEQVDKALQQADTPDLHVRRAHLLEDLGRAREAMADYRAALQGLAQTITRDSHDAKAYGLLSEMLLATGDEAGALTCVEEALILDDKLPGPHDVSANLHVRQAVAAAGQGDAELAGFHFRAAEQEATAASRLAPADPHPIITRFLAKWLPLVMALQQDPRSGLAQIAKFEEISESLKPAARLAPSYPRLRAIAIICKLTPFFTVQMVSGLDTAIWQTLDDAQKRVLTSCRDELVALAAEVVALRSEMLLYAAIADWMMDDRKAAYQCLRAAADAEPARTGALETMVGLTAYEGQWPQALPLVDEIRRRRASGRAWVWSGRTQAEMGRWKPAEKAFIEATKYPDAVAMANLGLGVVLLHNNAAPSQALAPLRVAWEKAPDEPEVLYAYGVALALSGKLDEGRGYVSHALDLWPATPALQRVARELGIKPR